jgi:GNAT superfamily N-acetyltransferase
MILYIIAAIVSIVVLFFGYVKVKYKFWSQQPVFHYYDIYYWFNDAGVINTDLPLKNKYYNSNILTKRIEDVPIQTIEETIRLIQSNYILNKENRENKFLPTKDTFIPYFTGHNSPCFFTTLSDVVLHQTNKADTILDVNVIVGVITSRALHIEIINQNIVFDAYYVDYLCVDKTRRNQGIAPQLIQTHEYNQRHNNPAIKVSIFKREDELTGIIPICAYDTYGFNASKWAVVGITPTILKCDKQNLYHLIDFIISHKNRFELTMIPEFSNLLELITSDNLIIYMMMDLSKAIIQSAYFFRKSCTYVSEKSEVLSCFASISNAGNKEFIEGFKTVACSMPHEYVSIERISDNGIIIDDLIKKTESQISKTAYFFYNFVYHTFDSSKVLIIN